MAVTAPSLTALTRDRNMLGGATLAIAIAAFCAYCVACALPAVVYVAGKPRSTMR